MEQKNDIQRKIPHAQRNDVSGEGRTQGYDMAKGGTCCWSGKSTVSVETEKTLADQTAVACMWPCCAEAAAKELGMKAGGTLDTLFED
jgi:hypothetical protein